MDWSTKERIFINKCVFTNSNSNEIWIMISTYIYFLVERILKDNNCQKGYTSFKKGYSRKVFDPKMPKSEV